MHANRSMPDVAVIPVLAYRDVDAAVRWLCAAFGFSVRWQAGNHRAQLAFGNGAFVVAHGAPVANEDSVMVRVDDADRHAERALAAGAQIASPAKEFPYGERQYTALDLEGRAWTFSQTIADRAPEDWGGTSG